MSALSQAHFLPFGFFNSFSALARYYLGVPWHRLEGFQAVVGVPVPDATQWEQGELVGDCAHPLFKCLEKEAAQGEVIYQEDTLGRVLALIAENRKAQAQADAQGKAKTAERTRKTRFKCRENRGVA